MVLGVGFVSVFVVAFIVQHQEISDYTMWVAGLVVLGIFVYMLIAGSSGERAGLIAALVLMVETLLFFIFYGQMSTSLTLFALRNVDLDQHLFGMTLWTWSPGQYQALNPIWIMLLSPILAWPTRITASRAATCTSRPSSRSASSSSRSASSCSASAAARRSMARCRRGT
jgi:POT family proton-dependent oligopeptide transporter